MVLQLHYVRVIKPHSRDVHEAPGLSRSINRIASLRAKKTLLPDISIFQRFFKFAIAKRECVILARYPWHRLAARADPSEVGEGGGGLPFENVRRLLRGRKYKLLVLNIFNHTDHRGYRSMVVRKEIS